ncbi:MAG: lysophospholipase [Alphaproteobacteria bacterium]|jgi:alpha-beta hydrolase superfamily lysophospholipase|nr:lysophospholipase [Alphaproteobacteria bacterium]
MKNSTFITFDNEKIYYSIWDEVSNPKGILQIIHGMAEHGGRYNDFALYLNKAGYIVYATDHRCHGKSAKSLEDIGYVGDNDIFHMVKDEQVFSNLIKEKHPNFPLFLMGHSMGSFILQKYLQVEGKYLDIKGAIIMGSAFASIEYYLGRAIAYIPLKIFGDKNIRNLEKILFKYFRFNFIASYAHILLSRDKVALQKYREDPYCQRIFSAKFYYELLNFMIDIFKKHNMELADVNTPLFIVSGKGDFVGGKSKKIKKLYKAYQDLGFVDVKMKLYKDSLHEIIHDKEKDIVYQDIQEWLDLKC